MKKVCIDTLLIASIVLITNASAQVSDAILRAMEGKNVRIQLDKGHGVSKALYRKIYFTGKLQKVEQNTIIMIGDRKGNIEEISKKLVLHIERKKINLNTSLNRWELGAIGWFLGFGIGSYIQGDTKGGTTGLIWDFLSISSIIATSVLWVSQFDDVNSDISNSDEFYAAYSTLYIFLLSALASKIFQAVRPHKWHKKNLAFLEGIYLVPDIAYNGYVGIKGGLLYSTRF